MKKVVVGFSGGVSSAWCANWALQHYLKEEVIFLFHDTKEEDEDTYRFIKEIADKLNHPITERSDGRSVTQLFYDENMLANDRSAFCSKTLKVEQRLKFFTELRKANINEIILIFGFSAAEPKRFERMLGDSLKNNYTLICPLINENKTKQDCVNWCCSIGVKIPRMYEWSNHANCVGCVRGGKNYWQAVKENRPDVFNQRVALEEEFGYTFMSRGPLKDLVIRRKRKISDKESINIGTCECGD
jgi:hypothetical protein